MNWSLISFCSLESCQSVLFSVHQRFTLSCEFLLALFPAQRCAQIILGIGSVYCSISFSASAWKICVFVSLFLRLQLPSLLPYPRKTLSLWQMQYLLLASHSICDQGIWTEGTLKATLWVEKTPAATATNCFPLPTRTYRVESYFTKSPQGVEESRLNFKSVSFSKMVESWGQYEEKEEMKRGQ